MLVSVCIPTYQGAAFLRQAIDSVLGQSLQDFELLVIDDASTDGTDALLRQYSDPRLRYLRNPRNLGPEGNWNRCLDEAQGDYIKLLPQDDVLAPDCLARQAAILQSDQDSQLALVFSARSVIDSNDRVLLRRSLRSTDGRLDAQRLRRQCLRRGTNLVGEPGAVMFRRSLSRRVGPFNGEIGYVIDLDYWFRLLAHGDAYFMAAPLASFRVSSGSWSVAIGQRQGREFRRFLHKAGAQGIDLAAGTVMAGVNNLLRMLFYRFSLKA